jgi:hypothetical protein
MTLGVPGTGPYGEIRRLLALIENCEYGLSLIEMKIKSSRGKKALEKSIVEYKQAIREIRAQIKAEKLAKQNKPD